MHRDVARALPLASASLAAGSKYGQFVFGLLCENGGVEVAKDKIQSVALVRMAAAQVLDAALHKLAIFYGRGTGDIVQDDKEGLRVLLLSAKQGYLPAFLQAGNHYEWLAGKFYQKAADGGNRQAKNQVRMFDRMYCGPPLDFDDDNDDDDDDYDGVDWTDGDGDDDDSEDEDDA
jgi:TPR repeat protein